MVIAHMPRYLAVIFSSLLFLGSFLALRQTSRIRNLTSLADTRKCAGVRAASAGRSTVCRRP